MTPANRMLQPRHAATRLRCCFGRHCRGTDKCPLSGRRAAAVVRRAGLAFAFIVSIAAAFAIGQHEPVPNPREIPMTHAMSQVLKLALFQSLMAGFNADNETTEAFAELDRFDASAPLDPLTKR